MKKTCSCLTSGRLKGKVCGEGGTALVACGFHRALCTPWLLPWPQQELYRREMHTQISGSRSCEGISLSPPPHPLPGTFLVYPGFPSLALCLSRFSPFFKCQPSQPPPGNLTGCSSTLKVTAGDARMGT